MKRILALVLLAWAAPSLHAQSPDTLDWLPVGTEWVYFGYHISEEPQYPAPPKVQITVEADILLNSKPAKQIRSSRSSSRLYLALENDTMYYAGPNRRDSGRITQWLPYFSTRVDSGTFFEGYAAHFGNHTEQGSSDPFYYKVEVVSSGDTVVNGYRLPYVDVRIKEDGERPEYFVFLCFWENKRDGYYYYRLYQDLISTNALFSDLSGPFSEFWTFGCGLRCFTHPQLGTIRFDSPERQAQFPDCHYGPFVSRPNAASAQAFRIWPNPATERIEIAFDSPYLRLEAYDMQGHRVHGKDLDAGDRHLTLDVSAWPTGVYLLRLAGEDGAISLRMLRIP